MTEEMLFAAALERETPADRATFLDEAWLGDLALRRRVGRCSSRLRTPISSKPPQWIAPAEPIPGQAWAGDTPGELRADGGDVESFDFLSPSDKPDSLRRLAHHGVLEVIGRGGMVKN